MYFQDRSDKRIILTKKDKSTFTFDDYKSISKLDNINKIVKEDHAIEADGIAFADDTFLYLYGNPRSLGEFAGDVDYGRIPENEYEILIEAGEYSSIMESNYEQYFDIDFHLVDNSYYLGVSPKNSNVYKIVGVKFTNRKSDYDRFYVKDELIKKTYRDNIYNISDIEFISNNSTYKLNNIGASIIPLDNVKEGTIIVPSSFNEYCKYNYCNGKEIKFVIKNRFYNDESSFKVSGVYSNKYNYQRLTGLSNYNQYITEVFMNTNDFNKLFQRDFYQTSVYIKDIKKIDDTILNLNNLGYKTFALNDALYVADSVEIIQIFKTIVTIILVVVLFAISYFVTKVIVKSRKIYFSTIRMLGSTKKICKKLLSIELLTISNIACLLFATVLILTKLNYIQIAVFKNILVYLGVFEYVLLYIIVNLMSYIISLKYAKQIFKNSAISSLKGED